MHCRYRRLFTDRRRRYYCYCMFAMSDTTTSKTDVPGRVPGDAEIGAETSPSPRPKPTRTRSSCSGCGRAIADRFLLFAMGRHWHVGCLRCSVCEMPLDDVVATCYTRAGLILCRTDYVRSVFHRVRSRSSLILTVCLKTANHRKSA